MEIIKSLDKENYSIWKKDIKVLLMERNCLGFAEGTEKEIDEKATATEITKYNQRKQRAYATIYLNISSEFRRLIVDTSDAKEALDILERHFQPASRGRVMRSLDEFFNLRIGEEESISLFSARIKETAKVVEQAGHQLDAIFLILQLIRYLPAEFANIVSIIYSAAGNILYQTIGNDIRNLANEFAQSRQRDQIRQHAFEVDLRQLDFNAFWALLEEVFRHGITVYNIVALFYFCSDVLIRAVKQELIHLGVNLFKWSLQYISEQVCEWVVKNGGWENAIKTVIKKKYFAYCTVGVICGVVAWGLYSTLKE